MRLASFGGYFLYREAGLWVLRLSITRMILSASGYMTSTRYLISSAQSRAVRCSWTLVWCRPPSDSTNAKMLRGHSVHTRNPPSGCRLDASAGLPWHRSAAGMAFRPCTRPDVAGHKEARRHRGRPPCMLRIRHPPFWGCTSIRFCEAKACFF